jgi:RimJ/RimL family protein N-acetyltransferase
MVEMEGPRTLETARLRMRPLAFDDAPFVVELLNEPSFLRYIGDNGVRSTEDACRYLREGPLAMYERVGFGLLAVERKDSGGPIGICGLLKRDTLPHLDLGFAFLPRAWAQGFAFESAAGVLADAAANRGLTRVLAITSLDNAASMGLLAKLGFRDEGTVRLMPEADEVRLLARDLARE